MSNEAPDWLLTMRSISGLSEKPGTADNDKILGMADEIARIFPDMKSYCDGYNHDSIPWCGLTVAYCMAKAGIRPPFGSTDTDRFLWAKSWADDPDYEVLKVPRLGCVVVLTRSGGGHVSTYESTSGNNYMLRGGNQSDAVNVAAFPRSNVVALVWPKDGPAPSPIEPSADTMPVLRKGSTGRDVAYLQQLLPKWIDGDFGNVTDQLVREFQRASSLTVDGVVGEATWAALLDEEPPLAGEAAPGPDPTPPSGVLFSAEGTCSWFGGPADTGVSPSEGLAFIYKYDEAPWLFLPDQPSGTSGLARRLDPSVFYLACRWDYDVTPKTMLRDSGQMALVTAKGTGISRLAHPADWGPHEEQTGRAADLSPGLMDNLGLDTDDEVTVVYPYVAD